MLRRRSLLWAVDTTLETLSDAGRRNVPREELIRQFKRMVDSLNRWYLPAEQQLGSSFYQAMVGKLMNLPQGQAGAPFPPADFVARETAALIRSALF